MRVFDIVGSELNISLFETNEKSRYSSALHKTLKKIFAETKKKETRGTRIQRSRPDSTTARGRAPLRTRVARPDPAELRLALAEPQIRDFVVAVARATLALLLPVRSHRRSSFTPRWKRTYKLSLLNLIRRQAEVVALATRARKQQVVAKISLHAHDDHDRHDSGKFTENSGFRRLRTVIRSTVAYSQFHNIETFRSRQGVDNSI